MTKKLPQSSTRPQLLQATHPICPVLLPWAEGGQQKMYCARKLMETLEDEKKFWQDDGWIAFAQTADKKSAVVRLNRNGYR